jgi:hypothetical protein
MAKRLIHINDMRKLLNSGEPVNLKCWKLNGDILVYNNVVMTSSYHKGNSFNIKFQASGEIRKVKAVCIHEINNMEVFL